MSAYIANPEAFALLAVYAAQAGLVPDAADAAELLARENIRSVAHRYPHDADGNRPGPALRDEDIVKAARLWTAHYAGRTPTALAAWSVADNISYQSCETEDWGRTAAYQLIAKVYNFIGQKPVGDAPWSYADCNIPAEVEALYAD